MVTPPKKATAGRFTVLGNISRGSFGRVDRVRLADGTVVARKVLDPAVHILQAIAIDKLRKRFEREVKVQSNLSHDSFLPILNHGLLDDPPWFDMPVAERNFGEEIDECRAAGSVPKEALAQVLDALEELHRLGLVHRDLKPQNILQLEGSWRLADLGLVMAPTGQMTTLTTTGRGGGTREYCAPEQAMELRHATAAADIYSFGCILHDIFDGSPRLPYNQYTCAGPIGRVIAKCTEREPAKRFKDIAALRGALFAVISAPPKAAPTPDAAAWVKDLETPATWDKAKLEGFARYIRGGPVDPDLSAVMDALDESRIEALHILDADAWKEVTLVYCDWVKASSFQFEYCDVVIRRLEAVFRKGDLDCKAAAALAAANLGRSHNRYFVMQRVFRMCGKELDDAVADRIALEIVVEGAEGDFLGCDNCHGYKLDDYHSRILAALQRPNGAPLPPP